MPPSTVATLTTVSLTALASLSFSGCSRDATPPSGGSAVGSQVPSKLAELRATKVITGADATTVIEGIIVDSRSCSIAERTQLDPRTNRWAAAKGTEFIFADGNTWRVEGEHSLPFGQRIKLEIAELRLTGFSVTDAAQ